MKDYLDDDLNPLPGVNWWTMTFGVENEDGVDWDIKFMTIYKDEVFFFKVLKTAPHSAQVIELAKRKVRVGKEIGWRLCWGDKRTRSPKILTKEQNHEGMWVPTKFGYLIFELDYRYYPAKALRDFEYKEGQNYYNIIWAV